VSRLTNHNDELLKSRAKVHGNFIDKAVDIQAMKYMMRQAPNWMALDPDMRESLDMFATKMARILHGEYSEVDHWDDVAGYANLVSERLRGNSR
jgi:hypothetical protein